MESYRNHCCFALVAACLLVVSDGVAADDTGSVDDAGFLDMSIDELLAIPVFSRPLLGLHHAHPKGEWMVSYSDRQMDMAGLLDGTSYLSTDDVFEQGFRVAPEEMHMHMSMLEAMYGVTDDMTVMVMAAGGFGSKSMRIRSMREKSSTPSGNALTRRRLRV